MRTVTIMRGLPGSGKSHIARLIANEHEPATICSADHFFEKSGIYKFDPKMIGKAHAECKDDFEAALQRKDEAVIVDNTNTQKWEYEWYVQRAEKHGYIVSIIRVDTSLSDEELAKRNTHAVPAETIRRMRERMK